MSTAAADNKRVSDMAAKTGSATVVPSPRKTVRRDSVLGIFIPGNLVSEKDHY